MTAPGDVTGLWASAQVTSLLAYHDDPPAYGSAAWLALAATDPRRAAALIVAAESWRREKEDRRRLEALADTDPEAWYREVTADARDEARRNVVRLNIANTPTAAERAARRVPGRPHVLRPTPGWPPVAVPGRPGHYLTYDEQEAA